MKLYKWFFLLIPILCAGGWIANIVKLFGSVSDGVGLLEVMRIVGIAVAPIGVILGYL
jgi:hypothetical protein